MMSIAIWCGNVDYEDLSVAYQLYTVHNPYKTVFLSSDTHIMYQPFKSLKFDLGSNLTIAMFYPTLCCIRS